MNIEHIENLLLKSSGALLSSDALEIDCFHREDVLLHIRVKSLTDASFRMGWPMAAELDALGEVEWDPLQVEIYYGGQLLGTIVAVDLRSLDDEFGAIVPLPAGDEVCRVAWAVCQAISHERPFLGFTADLGIGPGNHISTWHRWPLEE